MPRSRFPAFEQHFRTWLLEDYHHPSPRGNRSASLPSAGKREDFCHECPGRSNSSICCCLTVAKTRRVQQDGIRFQGYRYLDPTLAGYVKEEVVIRYDPADMAEIRVFYHDRFLCRAVCQELAGADGQLEGDQESAG